MSAFSVTTNVYRHPLIVWEFESLGDHGVMVSFRARPLLSNCMLMSCADVIICAAASFIAVGWHYLLEPRRWKPAETYR